MKLATLVKPALIAGLALALYIPVNMIQGLIFERQADAEDVARGKLEGFESFDNAFLNRLPRSGLTGNSDLELIQDRHEVKLSQLPAG